ncbi:MAG: hypothetical protein IJ105_04310 [Bacilli bacterium]|nr:hypothetical protein [Bacilli bacterium]
MNKNILDFYFKAINLKNVDRTGWKEVGVKTIESVMDHIGGTVLLASAIASEKGLNLDMKKVYEMIAIKELKKIEKEESVINGGEYSDNVKTMLPNSTLVSVYDEYVNGETEEAKFALMVSKLESDIQAKKYELDGEFTLENAKKDIENYPEDIKSQLTDINKASDGWLTYDSKYYNDEFKELSDEIRKM